MALILKRECTMKKNKHCLGCGIKLQNINILNLEFKQAFLANPIIFCTQPFIYYELIKMLYCYIHEKKLILVKLKIYVYIY